MFNYPIYPNQMQQQNNGFVSVRSEAEARAYPVAYGNSVTMKDETAPYILLSKRRTTKDLLILLEFSNIFGRYY